MSLVCKNATAVGIEISHHDFDCLIIDGLAYLEDVEEELDADFGDTEFETLNGYLTNILGHIPTDKDVDTSIKAIGYCFTILSIGNKTIGKVKVERDNNVAV